MVREAKLIATENSLVPDGESWFIVNARETRRVKSEELGRACAFEDDVREAYARFGDLLERQYRNGALPDW